MKPARFQYHAPTSLEEALDLLATHGDQARILAGGQSLMPLLNFRLARPAHLVDINGVHELREIQTDNGTLRLGAMVRQRRLERSGTVRAHSPLIAQAMPLVGHFQIRNRGTLGGSLAHADPAAELPAVMVALGANFTLQSKTARRVVAAEDFFRGELTTELRPNEMLTHVQVPASSSRTASSIQEVAIRRADFAIGGVASVLTLDNDGRIACARIVCFGVDDRPVRQLEAQDLLIGVKPSDEAFDQASQSVSAHVQPVSDIHASAAYRKRLVGILTRRALEEAARA